MVTIEVKKKNNKKKGYKNSEQKEDIMKKIKKTHKTIGEDNEGNKIKNEKNSNVKTAVALNQTVTTAAKQGKKKKTLGDFQIAALESPSAAVETNIKKKNNKKRNRNKTNSAPREDIPGPEARKAGTGLESASAAVESNNKKHNRNNCISAPTGDIPVPEARKAKTGLESASAAVEINIKKKKNKKRNRNKSISAPTGDKPVPVAKKAKILSKDEQKKVMHIPETEIKENFEDLSLGDNAHKLSDLINDMKVATKKNKPPTGKNKIKKGKNFKKNKVEELVGEEIKEKRKWATKRWNKNKAVVREDFLNTTLLVDNLPLKMILNFRRILTDHFSKYGQIKGFGVAEVYPAVESKPVFTTTMSFTEENAVTEALKNEVAKIEGSKVHLKKILPPEDSTIVIKSYSDLSEHRMSSIFGTCGRVRRINSLAKKGSHMSTAFVEFDGPEAVEKALMTAGGDAHGKKKMFASKYKKGEQKMKAKQAEKEESKPAEETAEDSNSESDEDSNSE